MVREGVSEKWNDPDINHPPELVSFKGITSEDTHTGIKAT